MFFIHLSLLATSFVAAQDPLASISKDTFQDTQLDSRGWTAIPSSVIQEYCGCWSQIAKRREPLPGRSADTTCGSPKSPCISTTCGTPKAPCASTANFCARCLVANYKGKSSDGSYDARCDCFTNYNLDTRFKGVDTLGNYNSACDCSGYGKNGLPKGTSSLSKYKPNCDFTNWPIKKRT
jgi:hypothetical protein